MNNLRNQFFKQQSKPLTEEDIPDIYHKYMVVYGWIPYDQFKDIPIDVFLTQLPKVEKEYKKKEELRVYTIRLLAGQYKNHPLQKYE